MPLAGEPRSLVQSGLKNFTEDFQRSLEETFCSSTKIENFQKWDVFFCFSLCVVFLFPLCFVVFFLCALFELFSQRLCCSKCKFVCFFNITLLEFAVCKHILCIDICFI